MTSIEFLNGLNGVEDFRAENEQIFLQQDQWNKLFKKSDIDVYKRQVYAAADSRRLSCPIIMEH